MVDNGPASPFLLLVVYILSRLCLLFISVREMKSKQNRIKEVKLVGKRYGRGGRLVAEDVDVVAGIDIEDGHLLGVADGALLLHTGHPCQHVEVAGISGDGDEEAAA